MGALGDLNTITVDLENPLTCLCTNNNDSQIAVAGRNILQLFSVNKDSFVLLHKMKPGGRSGPCGTGSFASGSQLNFSFSDVAWCPADESVLATASTNGSILLWDLSRQLINTRTIMAHLRTTHRIVFKPLDPFSLLSASQDGTVKLFDLRDDQSTHIQFACKGMNSSTRDVQYCPNYNSFVAAHENGQLIFWDLRNTGRPLRTIMGHACPIHCIDWHPRWSSDSFNWLATAGSRDHMIKVWDLNQSDVNSCIYSVRTSNVTRIRWRPDKHRQLASCCNLMFDLNIHIWELNRPYIPYATFEGHRDVVTGLTWKSDKDILFSVGKDGLLIRHSFKDAFHLVNTINPMALSLSPRGDILAAICSDKIVSNKGMRPGSALKSQSLQKRTQPHKLNFMSMMSSLFNLSAKSDKILNRGILLTPDIFVTMATSYRLCGSNLTELCNHNAQVAELCNQPYLVRFWWFLPFIFYNCSTTSSQTAHLNKDAQSIDRSETERGSDSRQNDSEPNTSRDKANKQDTISGANTDDSPDVLTEDDFSHLSNIAGLTKEPGDFLFYEGDDSSLPQNNYSIQKKTQSSPEDQYFISNHGFYNEGSDLPLEAFQPRHEIAEPMSFLNNSGTADISCQGMTYPSERIPLPLPIQRSRVLKSTRTDSTNSNSSKVKLSRTDSLSKREADRACELIFPSKQALINPLPCDLKGHVAELLLQLVEHGHLQTACTAILILGDHLNLAEVVDDSQQENWFRAYIDLLSRFRLWSIITQIINLSNHPNISILNQKSTKVITRCGRCSKALDRYGSYCHKHKDPTPIVCSICHQVVRGLFLWCQGCSHGGHLQHILEWYKHREECPTGCGHKCEFT